MKKTIDIDGMSCQHCAARVEKALNALPGVKAAVDLSAKKAEVVFDGALSDAILTETVLALGFDVLGIHGD